MPFPSDEKLMALSKDLLDSIDAIFGVHSGYRAVHAKGVLLTGTFTPTAAAAGLSRAQHLVQPSTPVFLRFSDNTGIPMIPDNDPNASPRGCAIRFQLAEHVHTDIVSHSANAFPAKDGREFLEFLRAIVASATSKASPSPVEVFVGSHPAALAFVQAAKPVPSSFAREAYFGLTAMRFTNKDGVSRYGRYRFVPDAGLEHLADEAAKGKSATFLFDEIAERIARGPVGFTLQAQIANEGDVVDDVTIHWPDDRAIVDLGKIALTGFVPNNPNEQKRIIFDPIPRLDGIEPSNDPLLELRAAIYLMSGRRRRSAPDA
ncbi:MAG TPA: catalase family peroxidase [Polyangiaceae bacterium]|jgi:catalase|nr:catalase family peroxidase [Polyangiaceae bacterium]